MDGLPLNSDGVETASAQLALGAAAADRHTQASAGRRDGGAHRVHASRVTSRVDEKCQGGRRRRGHGDRLGAPPVDKDAAKKSQSAVTMATQFGKNKPLVVAGDGVGDGNLISGRPRRPDAGQGDLHGGQREHRRRVRWPPAWPPPSGWSQDKVGQYGLAAGASLAGAEGRGLAHGL